MEFDHKKIEAKWAKKWQDSGIYKLPEIKKGDEKFYSLYSFPYPSGAGLHVGHVEGMVANDIAARYNRMLDKKTVLPMGWDSFGLPAENYAIKTGIHPQESTDEIVKNFKKQIDSVGISVSWDTEVAAHDPNYYKWTQWIFLQLYKAGLAYKKSAPVNWCPKDQTVLANEQVVNGRCERCDTEVVQKDMEQWFYRITDFAERLHADLDKVDWPESTKLQQRNWIGKSEGVNIDYRIADDEPEIKDIYENPQFDLEKSLEEAKKEGMKFMVLSVIKNERGEVLIVKRNESDHKDTWDLIGGSLKQDDIVKGLQVEIEEETGLKADGLEFIYSYDGYNPEFKTTYRYFVYEQIIPNDTEIKLSEEHSEYKFVSPEEAREKLYWEGHKRAVKYSQKITVFTTRPDTNFGATFVVVAPDGNFVRENIERFPNKKDVEKYVEETRKKTDLERMQDSKKKTGVFTGLYALNNLNNKKLPIYVGDFVLATVGTGNVVGVPGHDVRDFEFAKAMGLEVIRVVVMADGDKSEITDVKQVQEDEGTMINSGFLDGLDIHAATKKVIDYLEEKGWGKRVVNYKLRDWLLSRQRYWGCPIPIVYDPDGNPHPVDEKDLPVLLPHDVDFKPTGESPLKSSKEFHKSAEEKYGKGWRREIDTMDTFVDSSWYYFRHIDATNDKEFVDSEKANNWLPTDLYMIGTEHIVLHLLYSRFFTKFFFDQGYINFDEPFYRMRHMGIILGPDNRKMSKRWGNIINPTDVVERHGADTLRMYEVFMGPLEDAKPWDTKGETGVHRFLKKIWVLKDKIDTKYESKEQEVWINKLIKKVGKDIDTLSFNTSVAKFMEFSNFLQKEEKINQSVWERFLLVMAPFAPFVTEELWEMLGNKESVHLQKWPKFDEKLAQDETIKIAVQINGKARDEIEITPTESEDSVRSKVEMSEKAKTYLEGAKIKKFIYIPGKIVNVVI